MYYVSTQGVDERMINVHYYYYKDSDTNGGEMCAGHNLL